MNVSPVVGHNPHSFPPNPSSNSAQQSAASPTSNEAMWDSISPATPRNNQYRYSTSHLNPPGHQSNQPLGSHPTYPQSTTSTLPPQQFVNFATNRRVPPHIQAFRDAAAASSSSPSLFSSAQSPDHVPYRQIEPVSTVPHPRHRVAPASFLLPGASTFRPSRECSKPDWWPQPTHEPEHSHQNCLPTHHQSEETRLLQAEEEGR